VRKLPCEVILFIIGVRPEENVHCLDLAVEGTVLEEPLRFVYSGSQCVIETISVCLKDDLMNAVIINNPFV
jgi:hypothetical protein